MSVESSFVILGVFIASVGILGVARYGSAFNPLTVLAVNSTVFGLVSGIVAYARPSNLYDQSAMVTTSLLSMVSLAGAVLPYLFPTKGLLGLYGRGMRWLRLDSARIATRFNWGRFFVLLLFALIAYVCLAIVGGGGWLWLTDTRLAYQGHRSGAGVFYAIAGWFLSFSLLYVLWSRRPQRLLTLGCLLSIFVGLGYLTGSKGYMLSLLIVGLIYYDYRVRPVPLSALVALAPVFFGGALFLLVIQGAYLDALGAISYFREYFDNTAQFISRFGEFQHLYGLGWLSSFWYYVPRGLYPAKPYEYGITLINVVLFPGAAEAGGTPAMLGWALPYLDFGVLGVAMAAMPMSILQKVAYEYFRRNTQSLFAFVLALQISLWGILPFATAEMTVFLCAAFSVYLRLVWRWHPRGASPEVAAASA